MNRYPLWKYAIIVIALLVGAIYSLPNLFGEAPAVQVSPARATVKVDAGTMARVEEALKEQGIEAAQVQLDAPRSRPVSTTPTPRSRPATPWTRPSTPTRPNPATWWH